MELCILVSFPISCQTIVATMTIGKLCRRHWHAAKWPERALYWHYPHYYPTTTPVSALREGDWKLISYYQEDRVELFNLADDLGESNDLAAAFPDRTGELHSKLKRILTEIKAQIPTPNPNNKSPEQVPRKR